MSSKRPKIEKVCCPKCKKPEDVGFLGGSSLKKYFCANCCIEFTEKGRKIQVYEITSGGTVQ